MNLIKTKIDGLVILEPSIHMDERGCFFETYNYKEVTKLLGKIDFVQDNQSISKRYVLRGLHFQYPPHSQSKLVRCVKGEILDIAVDLRQKSRTYMQHERTYLSQTNKNMLYIPKGFAHGFVVLSEFAIISYKVDNYYNSKAEAGIIWNDSDLNIDWEIEHKKTIISEKDKKLPPFSVIKNTF